MPSNNFKTAIERVLASEPKREERLPRGSTPTGNQPYTRADKVRMEFPRIKTHRGFGIELTSHGNRKLVAPQGYLLPKELEGLYTHMALALKAIDEWLGRDSSRVADTGQLDPTCLAIETVLIDLGLSEDDERILKGELE